jgi:hypothetical protein
VEILQLAIYLPLIGFAIYRQFATAPVRGGVFWLLPLALIGLGLRGLSGNAIATPTAELVLALNVAVALGLGLARGLAVDVWTDDNGRAWRRGGRTLLALWVVSFAVRIGLGYAAGLVGVPSEVGLSEIPIFAGLTLGAQNLIVAWRANGSRWAARGLSVG